MFEVFTTRFKPHSQLVMHLLYCTCVMVQSAVTPSVADVGPLFYVLSPICMTHVL